MKTVVRGVSFLLAALLSVGVFAACDSSESKNEDEDKKGKEDEKVLTIEEIAKVLSESENGRASINIRTEVNENGQKTVVVADMAAEEDGDVAYTKTTMVMTVNGEEYMNQTQESYMTKTASTITTYTIDEETGGWVGEAVPRSDDDSTTGPFIDLLDAKYYNEYDASTGRYTMKAGESITVKSDDGSAPLVFTDCYCSYKDGVYTVFGKYTTASAPGVDYEMTLKYSDVGKVSVKLPEDIAG